MRISQFSAQFSSPFLVRIFHSAASFVFALLLSTTYIACESTTAVSTPNSDMKMAAINSNVQVHAWFTGKVQGVYFRKTTRSHAKKLSLTGWVKNLADGRVEMVAEGPSEKVEELMIRLNKKFEVMDLEREDRAASEQFSGFEIRR